jgi:ribosomal protein L14
MLISGSKLNIKDNSGATIAQCIQVTKSKKSKKPAKVADFIKATIKKGTSKLQVQKSKKTTSGGTTRLRDLVIIQTRKALRRLDGGAIRFNLNCGVSVSDRKLPSFKRVTTVVPFELKKSCGKILNLAKSII